MRYYFDTSSLRKNSNKLDKFKNKEIFTSGLAIFEILSGITEKDYNIRKATVKNILNSNISIDWDSYKMKFFKAYQIPFIDVEGIAIKMMAEILLDTSSLEEFKEKRVYFLENDYYTIEDLQSLDNDISDSGIKESERGIKEFRKEIEKPHRKEINKELFDNKSLLSYVKGLSEMSLLRITENISGAKRPSDKYFKTFEKYDGSLDMYLFCMQLQFSLAQLKGMLYAKNDTLDVLHTIFIKENDMIISEDKIFKELGNQYPGLKCYSSDELLEKL